MQKKKPLHVVPSFTWARPATCAAAAVLMVAGWARPSQAEPTDLLLYPSGDTLPNGVLRVNSDLYTKDFRTTTFGVGGLTYGFGSVHKGFMGRSEIGIDYVAAAPFANVTFGDRLRANAKTLLYEKNRAGVSLVAGGWGLGNTGSVTTSSSLPPNVAYLLATKYFKKDRVQMGVAQAISKHAVVAAPDGNAERTYLQLGYAHEFSRALSFRVDYYSGKSNISAFVPGLHLNLGRNASFRLGYIRYNDASIAPGRNQIILGFDLLTDDDM